MKLFHLALEVLLFAKAVFGGHTALGPAADGSERQCGEGG